jgi:predicted flavoprotein YhiN
LTLRVDGDVAIRLRGSMLWTHFGVSGPVALNVSRHWLRAGLDGQVVELRANFCPGQTFEEVDRLWMALAAKSPRSSVQSALASMTPAAFAFESRRACTWASPGP